MAKYHINKILLRNFLGFYGDHTFEINNIAGYRNMLIYGENGSGKTSLYRGIEGFFNKVKNPAETTSSRDLNDFRNVFMNTDKQVTHIELHFTNINENSEDIECSWGDEYDDDEERNITKMKIEDETLKRACMNANIAVYDYSHILDIYYEYRRKQEKLINIGSLIIEHILFNYKLGGDTVSKWIDNIRKSVSKIKVLKSNIDKLRDGVNLKHKFIDEDYLQLELNTEEYEYEQAIKQRDKDISRFNNLLVRALDDLQSHMNDLLKDFESNNSTDNNLTITKLKITRDLYIDHNDQIVYPRIIPIISYFQHEEESFHILLNEARISALMLSMLFSKYLMIPPAKDEIKLLVLDDILIGIDINNRFKVLRILDKHFSDWQIFIMTYDRLWYDTIIRNSTVEWNHYEMYAKESNIPQSIIRPISSTKNKIEINRYINYLLQKSKIQLNDYKDANAAGLYIRLAYEELLKQYCDNEKIAIPYQLKPKYTAKDFYEKIITHKSVTTNNNLKKIFNELKELNVVQNNTAHEFLPNYNEEISNSIDKFESLLLHIQEEIKDKKTQSPSSNTSSTASDTHTNSQAAPQSTASVSQPHRMSVRSPSSAPASTNPSQSTNNPQIRAESGSNSYTAEEIGAWLKQLNTRNESIKIIKPVSIFDDNKNQYIHTDLGMVFEGYLIPVQICNDATKSVLQKFLYQEDLYKATDTRSEKLQYPTTGVCIFIQNNQAHILDIPHTNNRKNLITMYRVSSYPIILQSALHVDKMHAELIRRLFNDIS